MAMPLLRHVDIENVLNVSVKRPQEVFEHLVRYLLAIVGRGLVFWGFRSLAPPLRPIQEEVRTLPGLRLTLGKALRLTFRGHPSVSQGRGKDGQQPLDPLSDP
jgi:hypothetical protein